MTSIPIILLCKSLPLGLTDGLTVVGNPRPLAIETSFMAEMPKIAPVFHLPQKQWVSGKLGQMVILDIKSNMHVMGPCSQLTKLISNRQ